MNYIHYKKCDTIKMVAKQIGGLQVILGYIMMVPAVVSVIYSEYYSALGFVLSAGICLLVGFGLYKGIQPGIEPVKRHALIIAALGWLIVAVMGSLPFIIIAWITPHNIASAMIPHGSAYGMSSIYYFKNPLHAIFDSMSAYTTTGLSMAVHEPSIGRGLLFYRSFAQWTGGAGFIVLALAVLGQANGKTAMYLYGSETPGERLKPTIIETARSIWKAYLGVTLFSFVYLFIGTLIILPDYDISVNLFDSLNHAMNAQSTGGFSTLDDSIAGYNSKAMEMLYVLPMVLGALSLPFYFKLANERRLKIFWTNLQTRSIIIWSILGSVILSLMLIKAGVVNDPFRIGIFQFVSALSTTGWQTCDVHLWDSAPIFFISMAGMVVGGAAGATVGGLKIIRVLLIFKGLFWHINGYFSSSNSIKVVKFNEKRLLPLEMNSDLAMAATFSFIYLLFIFISTIITYYLMDSGYTLKDALFESASAQGTVGLSCGITHPGMNAGLEIMYVLQMWAGRLEIIPVLVLMRTLLFGTRPVIA